MLLKYLFMKSSIRIDVDYDNQPIIKIEYQESDDVRDKLVKKFLETFGGDSCWASFEFKNLPTLHRPSEITNSHAVIRPICVADMPEVITQMKAVADTHVKMRERVFSEPSH